MELAEDFAEYIYFGVKSITVSSNFSQWLSCKENKLQTGLIAMSCYIYTVDLNMSFLFWWIRLVKSGWEKKIMNCSIRKKFSWIFQSNCLFLLSLEFPKTISGPEFIILEGSESRKSSGSIILKGSENRKSYGLIILEGSKNRKSSGSIILKGSENRKSSGSTILKDVKTENHPDP